MAASLFLHSPRPFLLLLSLLCLAQGCNSQPSPTETVTIKGETMGTTYRAVIAAPLSNPMIREVRQSVTAELDFINDLMSTYREDSELSVFNRADPDSWHPVSPEVITVVDRALSISAKTDGAFDITVGPLVNLWGFGRDSSEYKVPKPAELAMIEQRIGYGLIEIRKKPPALKKNRAGVEIDLSAIAKGYAVDRIGRILTAYDLENYLVEIGGEILCRGGKGDRPWIVGIELPREEGRTVHRTIQLHDRAAATSGNYRIFFKEKGKRYSHAIDPRTGFPVTHELASVTVLAENCMSADAWATAFMIMGYEKASKLTEKENIATFFILRRGQGFIFETAGPFDRLTAGVN